MLEVDFVNRHEFDRYIRRYDDDSKVQMARAINKGGTRGKSLTEKGLRKYTGAKLSMIRGRIYRHKKANKNNLRYDLRYRYKNVNLDDVKYKKNKTGVATGRGIEPKRDYRSAFLLHNRTEIYKRSSGKRYPIKRVSAGSISASNKEVGAKYDIAIPIVREEFYRLMELLRDGKI